MTTRGRSAFPWSRLASRGSLEAAGTNDRPLKTR